MSGFAVSLSSVQHTASVTTALGSELGSALGHLRREADRVLSDDWRGPAAMVFDRAWCAWDVGARELVAALDRLAELLAATEREYTLRDLIAATELRRAAS